MNLTKTFPRSPKETLAGLVHIPRMIDKARARNAGTLGEYIFPCPLDNIILNFLDVTAEEFAQRAEDKEDDSLACWVEEKIRDRAVEEKQSINREILGRKPDTQEKKEKFLELRDAIDPSRTDIQTWVDLIDLEEGRL
ncbi:MAG: DUF5069 domain-containing protein [Nitrospinales bacterium]